MKRFGTTLITIVAAALAGPVMAQVPIEPENMMATVKHLSDQALKGRGLGTPELDQAAAFIARRFEAVGLMPGGTPNGSWYQEWTDRETGFRMRNVVGILPGRSAERGGQSVVIGAHYDGLGTGRSGARKEDQGKVHPGADDNASGVAVLLELVDRLTLVTDMERTIVFVAFTGEEAGRKGSRHYVENEKRYPVSRTAGMINLDTVGRLGKGKLIVLGSVSAKEWPAILREAGGSAGVEIAESVQELDSSDQKSFIDAGVPAVQFFTGAHLDYHRPTDTADRIDGKGLVKVATVARAAAFAVANLPAPLTRAVAALPAAPSAARTDRKVTIGIIPDFTYNEKGVRLGGTQPGGPAEKAGMREGDVIVRAGSTPVAVLKDLSDALKSKQPGEKLPVRFLRGGKELSADLELKER